MTSGPYLSLSTDLVSLGDPMETQVLTADMASVLSPTGRYLAIERVATQQQVVDLTRQRVVAEITGSTTQIAFTGVDRALLFWGDSHCELSKARAVNFATQKVRKLRSLRDG